MHHKAIGANRDALGAGVEVDPLVQIGITAQVNLIGKAQAYATFNCGDAIHAQDEPITERTQPNADNRRHPPDQQKERLFQTIARQTAGLACNIKT